MKHVLSEIYTFTCNMSFLEEVFTKYSTCYTLMSIGSCEQVIGSFNQTLCHISVIFILKSISKSLPGSVKILVNSIPQSNLQNSTFVLAPRHVTPSYKKEDRSMQFFVPTDVINLCRKIQIRKYRHYGGQAM